MDARRHAYLAMAGPEGRYTLRPPCPGDGAALHDLIRRTPPLDPNSCYAYLLQGLHLADTCALAEGGDGIAAYVSAYRPPGRPDTLFVWQVAVDTRHRGRGLARALLGHLLERPACAGVRWLETTVSPSNTASRRLFEGLARDRGCRCIVTPLFAATDFGAATHEAEPLLRIGPLVPIREDTMQ